MRDKELVLEILRQIEVAAEKIINRFQPILKVNDFTDSPAGMETVSDFLMDPFSWMVSLE